MKYFHSVCLATTAWAQTAATCTQYNHACFYYKLKCLSIVAILQVQHKT